MEQIRTGDYMPYTFHMCWTQTKADKLKNIKDAKLWHLTNTCSDFDQINGMREQGHLDYDTCCRSRLE
jgi:hypothetical protein